MFPSRQLSQTLLTPTNPLLHKHFMVFILSQALHGSG
ncbi:hypothetical protein BZ21_2435 [Yersinia pseudotuberculosis]|nr:hypothetical protein BZ21_2435 [Yersinia pseudotuberculosis]AJJ67390.1 hypothetical protein BZ16_2509 [Yersinia pseudotuberculosis PB1/+]CQD54947.1 Uncharacterised protein [Yersinia intermedia]AJJ71762.1 hypothetical protein BZ23_2714 [Yersinia pseudotuberculosis]CFQ94565.1 Uncharacterised protein [Yersinia pseudotuberculosis]